MNAKKQNVTSGKSTKQTNPWDRKCKKCGKVGYIGMGKMTSHLPLKNRLVFSQRGVFCLQCYTKTNRYSNYYY